MRLAVEPLFHLDAKAYRRTGRPGRSRSRTLLGSRKQKCERTPGHHCGALRRKPRARRKERVSRPHKKDLLSVLESLNVKLAQLLAVVMDGTGDGCGFLRDAVP